jgi:hypothetical protein
MSGEHRNGGICDVCKEGRPRLIFVSVGPRRGQRICWECAEGLTRMQRLESLVDGSDKAED